MVKRYGQGRYHMREMRDGPFVRYIDHAETIAALTAERASLATAQDRIKAMQEQLDDQAAHDGELIAALTAERDAWRSAYQALADITTSGGIRHSTDEQDRRLQAARKAIRALSLRATP